MAQVLHSQPQSGRDDTIVGLISSVDRLVKQLLPFYTADQLDDFRSEARIALVHAVDSYAPDKQVPLSKWVQYKVKTHILDVLRKERKRMQRMVDFVYHAPSASKQVDYTVLMHAIGTLPDISNRVITLYFMHGYTEEEVGQRLGIKRHQVNYVKRRALDTLRKSITEE